MLTAVAGAGSAGGPPVVSGSVPDEARPGEGRVIDSRPPVWRAQMRVVASNIYSGFEREATILVRSPSNWRDLRPFFGATVEEEAEIDFDEEMILVAALGPKPTGGYEVSIDGVEATGEGSLEAHVRVVEPGEGCMLTQARTSPAVAVAVERRDVKVEFVRREETRPCG